MKKRTSKWVLVGLITLLLGVIAINKKDIAYAVGGRVLVDFLQFSANSAPALSPSSKSVTYYDSTLNYNLISENGGAYRRASLLGRTDTATPFISTLGSTGATDATGVNNTATGYQSGNVLGTSTNNTTNGFKSGLLTTGSNNSYFGSNSGGAITTGSSNVFLGDSADGTANNVAGGIAIGRGALAGSNEFVVGSESFPSSNWYGGKGITSTTVAAFQINGTGGSGTDNAGGAVIIAAGKGTGTSKGGTLFFRRSPSIATGTTAQTLYDAYTIVSKGTALTDNVATTVATWTLANGTSGGGTIHATIQCTDATDFQSMTQMIEVALVNKAGTYTTNIVSTSGAKAVSAGTLTTVWTITSAGAVQVAADTSLTPSGTNAFVIYYQITNNGQGNVSLP